MTLVPILPCGNQDIELGKPAAYGVAGSADVTTGGGDDERARAALIGKGRVIKILVEGGIIRHRMVGEARQPHHFRRRIRTRHGLIEVRSIFHNRRPQIRFSGHIHVSAPFCHIFPLGASLTELSPLRLRPHPLGRTTHSVAQVRRWRQWSMTQPLKRSQHLEAHLHRTVVTIKSQLLSLHDGEC